MNSERVPVLITGGTGFLGSEIVRALVATSCYDVTAVDINPPSLGTSISDKVRYVRANVLQPEELQKVFYEAKPAVVIHTVGVYHVGDMRYSKKGRETMFEINVTGTRNVIEASKGCGARAFVYTSSTTVLMDEMDAEFRNADETWPTGRATTTYGQSKVWWSRSIVLCRFVAICALMLSVSLSPFVCKFASHYHVSPLRCPSMGAT
jgi:sterol-4alpha-carboxylate 3-dehydrogenase (decarboxylating)